MTAGTMPNYPLHILRGCASLDEVEVLKDLPDGYIRITLRLIKKINLAKPTTAIFARRDTLARESGKSVETVGRALKWLEDQGLITREVNIRPGLRGSEGLIYPTKKLVQGLFIGQEPPAPSPAPVLEPPSAGDQAAELSPVIPDGPVSAKQEQQFLTERQSHGETRAKPELSTTPARKIVRIEGKTIPAELGFLARSGKLAATAILSLMKLATAAGKRLSDVVAVTKDRLVSLQGKNLFAYLRTLIAQDKDWGYINRKNTEEATQALAKQQETDLVKRKAEEWIGRRFHAKDGRLYEIEAGGRFRVTDGKGTRVGFIDAALVEAIQEGHLRPVSAGGRGDDD